MTFWQQFVVNMFSCNIRKYPYYILAEFFQAQWSIRLCLPFLLENGGERRLWRVFPPKMWFAKSFLFIFEWCGLWNDVSGIFHWSKNFQIMIYLRLENLVKVPWRIWLLSVLQISGLLMESVSMENLVHAYFSLHIFQDVKVWIISSPWMWMSRLWKATRQRTFFLFLSLRKAYYEVCQYEDMKLF